MLEFLFMSSHLQNKVIVTGGAGFIGSHICKTLHKEGYLPVSVDNLQQGHISSVLWGPLEVGDIRDQAFLYAMMEKYQPISVIHCAALAYVGESTIHPAKYYRTNVEGTLRLLEAIHHHQIGSIIFASSCAAYGNAQSSPIHENHPLSPINPYGWSKFMGEQIIRDFADAYELKYAILRYFNVAGADLESEIGENHDPETHLIPLAIDAAITNKSLLVNGIKYETKDGTAVRDYIHVQDLAGAHVLALQYLQMDNPSITLNLGSGQGFSILEILQKIESITKKKVLYKIAAPRLGDPPLLVADRHLANEVLAWNPRYSDLDTLITTAWDWYQKKQTLGEHHESIATHSRLSSPLQCGI